MLKRISHYIFVCITISSIITGSIYAKKKSPHNTTNKHACIITTEIVNTIASGDMDASVTALQYGMDCPKQLYLLREITRISRFDVDSKPKKYESYKVYKDVAIAYHNLYLFLKTNGIEQNNFLNEAQKYYHKARKGGTSLHKQECDILLAALIAASGDANKAEKIFSKVDKSILRGGFESMEFLSAYYGAAGDVGNAVITLNEAYSLNPNRTIKWLEVGDDFYKLQTDTSFIAMKESFKTGKPDDSIYLSVPTSKEPKLDMRNSKSYFLNDGDMPKYKKKGNR